MKKHIARIIILLLVLLAFPVLPAMAQSESHDHGNAEDAAHKMMDKAKSAGHEAMDHGKMGHDMPAMGQGEKNWLREAHVKGHHLAYELIDMREKMKGMPGMKNTHHLMLYIKDGHGNKVEKAKVGYLIEGPGDLRQKAMCMGMGGGFGSDVNLGEPGTYTIKAKVVAGDTKLMDSFEYVAK